MLGSEDNILSTHSAEAEPSVMGKVITMCCVGRTHFHYIHLHNVRRP